MNDFLRIIKIASAKKRLTIFLFVVSLAQMLVSASFPLVQKLIFDLLEKQIREKSDLQMDLFIGFFSLYVLLMVLEVLLRLWDTYFKTKWWVETRNIIALKVFDQLERLSISYWEKTSTGKIIEKQGDGVNKIQNVMDAVVDNILPQLLYITFAIIVLLKVSTIFGVVILVCVPLFILISIKFTKPINTLQEKTRDQLEKAGKIRVETFSNIKTVKSFATEVRHYKELKKALEGSKKHTLDRMKLYVIMNSLRFTIVHGSRLFLLGLGAYWVSQGKMTLGTLVMIWSYAAGIFAPLWTLSRLYDRTQQDMVSIRRLFEIIDTKPEVVDVKNAENLIEVGGDIGIKGLKFKYKNRNIINGVDLDVPKGQVVAVIGKSGVGKSTLVKLLLRFYDPQEGKILIDGHDVREVTQESLRENIGVVLQDTAIFNDTALNNISYSNPKATKNEVIRAAKVAHAHEFITKLPEGYETVVGERGVKLSGGEQQRINIARAVLKNPPILVLDEATSHLDSESEKLIQDALWKLIEGRTSIIIAHRLSTIMKADLIVVLDKGKIAETGTHAELVKKEGIYNKLFKIQSGSYLK